MPDIDLGGQEATARERIGEERDDLGVGAQARIADELDPRLVVLALGAAHRGLFTEDRREVREPQRGRRVAIALRDDARDRGGDVGSQREQPAVAIEEPQHPPLVDASALDANSTVGGSSGT